MTWSMAREFDSLPCNIEFKNLLGDFFLHLCQLRTGHEDPELICTFASLSMGFSGKSTGVGCHFLLQFIRLCNSEGNSGDEKFQ